MSKNLIKKVVKAYQSYEKMDLFLFNILSNKYYEKYASPIHQTIQDLSLIALTGRDWDELHSTYSTPGENNSSKPIAWNNGFIPDNLESVLKTKMDDKVKVEKINNIVQSLKKIDKEWNEKK